MDLDGKANDLYASFLKSRVIRDAIKQVTNPLAAAVQRELYPYIYFSLILVTASFILHIAVFGIVLRSLSRERGNSPSIPRF